jgi:hypothetical protein
VGTCDPLALPQVKPLRTGVCPATAELGTTTPHGRSGVGTRPAPAHHAFRSSTPRLRPTCHHELRNPG